MRERVDARLAHERARAAPAPQGAADSKLSIMVFPSHAHRAPSQDGWGADRGADKRRRLHQHMIKRSVSKRRICAVDIADLIISNILTICGSNFFDFWRRSSGTRRDRVTESCGWSTHREGARPPRSRHPARRDAAAASGGVMPRAAACA